MYRVGIGYFRCGYNTRNIKVTVFSQRGPDTHGLIGISDMKRIPVGCGINPDSTDAQLTAGLHHAQRDFTAVCNKYFFKQCSVLFVPELNDCSSVP